MFNSQVFKKDYIYPKYWNDEDISNFKIYLEKSKEYYPDLPENIIELAVERQINEDKGLLKPIDYSTITDIKIETPFYQEFNSTEELEVKS